MYWRTLVNSQNLSGHAQKTLDTLQGFIDVPAMGNKAIALGAWVRLGFEKGLITEQEKWALSKELANEI